MKSFPMFLRMDGRRVVFCGGGEEIARKVRLILKTEAEIVLVAEALDAELLGLVRQGRARLGSESDLAGAALAFVATGDIRDDARLAALARAGGAVVNVVDRPELCEAFTPSIVDRDPVVVAIGTEGTAPVLGRAIKTEIEGILDPQLGGFAALAGRLRDAVAATIPHRARRAFWEWAFSGAPFQRHRAGDEAGAAELLKQAIASGEAPVTFGHVALVGAGPGARDLLTLRAVRRMQEADVIFYDRLVDPQVLELARRDADRVYIGKQVGACAWPQERINRLIVAEARKGRRVVRLKSGDPSIFGRTAEEIDAARAAGIAVEIVAGVTAASAAAAALCRPLTTRGETDSVVLTTGTLQPGTAAPDHAALARAGTTLVFHMALERAAEVERQLLAAGVPPQSEVDVVSSASSAAERQLSTRLAGLAMALRDAGIEGPVVLVVRRGKAEAADPRPARLASVVA